MNNDTFRLKVVNKQILQSIHEQSIHLLANAGVEFDNPEIIQLFSANGQRTNGKRVYLSEAEQRDDLEIVVPPRPLPLDPQGNLATVTALAESAPV